MQAFDLNIEKVLEHWSVPFAIRELIANALDEQALTGTADPVIVNDGAGCWHIADAGRGVRYEHLTQNENAEKRRHPQVIGQFGIDAPAGQVGEPEVGIGVERRFADPAIEVGGSAGEGGKEVGHGVDTNLVE